MEIFSQEMMYRRGDLMAPENGYGNPMMCVSTARKFFDLPTANKINAEQIGSRPQYVVSVHDRKKKYGVRVRLNPKTANCKGVGPWLEDNRRIQVESADDEGHISWDNIGFYGSAERAMLGMFDETGKKALYVVVEFL